VEITKAKGMAKVKMRISRKELGTSLASVCDDSLMWILVL
jgi:hypothetical protein